MAWRSGAGRYRRVKSVNVDRHIIAAIPRHAFKDRINAESCAPRDNWEILGVNSKQELARLERIYQSAKRECDNPLRDRGVICIWRLKKWIFIKINRTVQALLLAVVCYGHRT